MTNIKTATKETDHSASRQVTDEDLALLDKAIADHEVLQKDLYLLRHLLGEIGKLDARSADLKRGIEGEQSFLDDLRKQTGSAQEQLTQLQKHIEARQRELREVEQLIQERNIVVSELNEGYLKLRAMLEAA
jgi:hypothetical protein